MAGYNWLRRRGMTDLLVSANWATCLTDQPVNKAGRHITGVGLTRDDRDIPCSWNPDFRQRRHQSAAGNVDVQHRERANADTKSILHRLARDEEVIENLSGRSGQVLEPCRLEPGRPVAAPGFGRKQRVPLDVGGLEDRPLREQGRAHDQGLDIIQHRNDVMLWPHFLPSNTLADRYIDATADR